ncbi:MAG: hypothetical protein ACRDAM_20820 [Casimicrobium sp.]
MDLKQVQFNLERAEGAGKISTNTKFKTLHAAIALKAQQDFATGFYGTDVVSAALDRVAIIRQDKALSAAENGHNALMGVINANAQFLGDELPVWGFGAALHTTSDFPAALALIRSRVIREPIMGVTETPLMALAVKRTAPDFRLMKGVRPDPSVTELRESPENETIRYIKWTENEDGYVVSKYRNAVAWSYEMQKNGDIEGFLRMMREMGSLAARTRSLNLIRAVKLKAARVTLAAGAGGPTAARIEEVYNAFSAQQDKSGVVLGRTLGKLHIPSNWVPTAASAFVNTIATGGENPLRKYVAESIVTPDPLLSRVTGGAVTASDWLAYAEGADFVEFSVLDDFAAGPRVFTKMGDSDAYNSFGSFQNCSFEQQIMDGHASKMTDDTAVQLIAGA